MNGSPLLAAPKLFYRQHGEAEKMWGRKNACGGAKTLTYNSNHDPVFKLNEEAQNKNFDAVWHDVPSGIWD